MSQPRRILINGTGRVGRALLRAWDQVQGPKCLVCAADSRGAWRDEAGLDPATLLRRKEAGDYDDTPPPGPELIREVQPDILVELTVTNLETGRPAVPNIRTALTQGTAVVTSAKSHQKSPEWMTEFLELGRTTPFLDHAAILAGIPATEMMAGVGMRLEKIEGVLNGTTNFILARLWSGADFDDALKEAIERGFAERRYEYDIQGTDAAVKLVGLCRKFLGRDLALEAVDRSGLWEGKRGIEGIDAEFLHDLGEEKKTLKLFAEARLAGNDLRARVYPKILERTDPFAGIRGFQNAIRLTGRMNETEMTLFLSGPGAGADETASRVLGNLNHLLDLLDWKEGERA